MDGRAVLRAATDGLRSFRRVPAAVREELGQEAALRTWMAPGVALPEAFARRVVRRLAIDWLRRCREVPLGPSESVDPRSLWSELEARSVVARFHHHLVTAPPGHREVLVAFLVGEESVEEVAARLGPGSARLRDLLYKRRRRALSWIRTRLNRRDVILP